MRYPMKSFIYMLLDSRASQRRPMGLDNNDAAVYSYQGGMTCLEYEELLLGKV